MRAITLFAAAVLLAPTAAKAACDGGVVAAIYDVSGAVFRAEINGVPFAHGDGEDKGFTGTRRLAPWLLEGRNIVSIVTDTAGEGGLEALMNCPNADVKAPGENADSFGFVAFDAVGSHKIEFDATRTLDMPYADAVHDGDAGLADAVHALQAAFRSADPEKIADGYGGMIAASAASGRRMERADVVGMMTQVLPDAVVTYLDDFEIRSAMGGRIRVVTAPDGFTPPIMFKAGPIRLRAGRIWSYMDGRWQMVAQ